MSIFIVINKSFKLLIEGHNATAENFKNFKKSKDATTVNFDTNSIIEEKSTNFKVSNNVDKSTEKSISDTLAFHQLLEAFKETSSLVNDLKIEITALKLTQIVPENTKFSVTRSSQCFMKHQSCQVDDESFNETSKPEQSDTSIAIRDGLEKMSNKIVKAVHDASSSNNTQIGLLNNPYKNPYQNFSNNFHTSPSQNRPRYASNRGPRFNSRGRNNSYRRFSNNNAHSDNSNNNY